MTPVVSKPRTLYDKIWDSHVVDQVDTHTYLLYVDRQLVHEVTSPQAFEGVRMNARNVRNPHAALAVADHAVPTRGRAQGIKDPESRIQIKALEDNCAQFDISYFPLQDRRQGIVHVIGPEQGLTHPGMVIVCGDSHTSTHGAFGALAFGIGTSEVEHVLVTQTLLQRRSKNMRINVNGKVPRGVGAKDVILAIIGHIGTAGGNGHVIEYAGDVISALPASGRMSICNMSIEAGARAGLVAPDETTFAWLKGRPMAPSGAHWDKAVDYWRSLVSDADARYDREVHLDATDLSPQVTWGTSPQDVVGVLGRVPNPADEGDSTRRKSVERSLEYMGLSPGTKMTDIAIDHVFIGSCTNSRIEDLRAAAAIVAGNKVHGDVQAMVVPGSGLVKMQAEEEGLDRVFMEAGFDWREPGCSMCLAMNPDKLKPGERCVSTSNRNFEGRQGRGGRTHLASPIMAAAAAICGNITDVRDFL